MKSAGLRTARRLATLIAAAVWLVSAASQAAASPGSNGAPPAPGNQAKAAALIDVTSGRILFSQRGDEPMKIASLTKIMTAIVAIEQGNLEDKVTVSVRAAGKEGSSLYLKAGEKITLKNLLYGLMLRSGNDAAVAIAEHVGGSLEGFVFLMNKKAEELGLSHSHFANPHGLDQPGHLMSANDLAKLSAYSLQNPTFREIVKTRVKMAPNPNEQWDYKWVNKNKMLTMYDGADGVKTGYTKQALRTLVSSATRGGQQLAAVTLNDGNDWADHKALLDYGFKYYPLQTVIHRGQPIPGTPYTAAADFRYPLASGERGKLSMKAVKVPETAMDFVLGYRGRLEFEMHGERVGSVPIR
ncbi:D-alanyl-D-alanine carboxypeptidase family protein [Cohnella candidum]|uniref:D-alanyl-D-alanine carboxypeptidase n=1 Tax=Cohnella candidum TaxID=2674991 RepID=A0A3G3JX28_9BACL|nr:D-alanyl-D-alanine carboxypeptidase family protein [Cohnella candidum]AYQ72765.1 D-alanyl-D-alanine carboxypeptidase [Cohnella candidum]